MLYDRYILHAYNERCCERVSLGCFGSACSSVGLDGESSRPAQRVYHYCFVFVSVWCELSPAPTHIFATTLCVRLWLVRVKQTPGKLSGGRCLCGVGDGLYTTHREPVEDLPPLIRIRRHIKTVCSFCTKRDRKQTLGVK